jgi:hypothetical protein
MPEAPTIAKAIRLREAESEILDLKSATYENHSDWLKDVTAFANTTGGRILIGVSEDDDGRAKEALGIEVSDLDGHIQTLNQWLRTRTDPDVSGAVRIAVEENETGRKFIIADVEESAFAPHRINTDSSKMNRQVYVRKGRDSVPVDMAEIREIMMGRHRTLDSIAEFIQQRRLGRSSNYRIAIGRTILDESGPKDRVVIFHVCPRRGFGSRALVDWILAFENEQVYLGPDKHNWLMTRPNSEGAFSEPQEGPDGTRHQLFYNGAAELIHPDIYFENRGRGGVVGPWIKARLEGPVAHAISVMKQATGCDQFEVDVMIEGVKDLHLIWGSNGQNSSRVAVDEDTIYFPSTLVRIGADGRPLPQDLRAILDVIARAWGEKVYPA